MKATQLYKDFFESEKSGGLVLIAFTLISLAIANSAFGNSYLHYFTFDLLHFRSQIIVLNMEKPQRPGNSSVWHRNKMRN